MNRALNALNCFGQSKYEAKQKSYEQGNNGKVKGIYSKKTMSDYKQVADHFNTWAKAKGYRFKSLSDVSNAHIMEYLAERQNSKKSAWTTSKELSALNKIFGRSITKKEAGLNARRNADIKNNRGLGNNYRNSVYKQNKALTDFISATGIRRQSVATICPTNAIRNTDGTVIGFRITEKGGKSRNALVLKSKQEQITKFVNDSISKNGNQPFWNAPNKNLNTHWYRGEYAKALYNELLQAKADGQDYYGGYRSTFINEGKYEQAIKGHNSTTKGYDTECLALVSQSLGHNRIDVVYSNYLSRF